MGNGASKGCLDDHGNTATENLAVPGLATLGASPSASERAASMNAIHAHAESELARLTQRLTSVMAELNEARRENQEISAAFDRLTRDHLQLLRDLDKLRSVADQHSLLADVAIARSPSGSVLPAGGSTHGSSDQLHGTAGVPAGLSAGANADVDSQAVPLDARPHPHARQAAHRNAVSSEPIRSELEGSLALHKEGRDDKSASDIELICRALKENKYTSNLSSARHQLLAQHMELITCTAGDVIIRQGDDGNHVFVTREGQFEVTKDGEFLTLVGVGQVMGELAILYKCQRTASVQAKTDGSLWSIDRASFQYLMMKMGVEQQQEHERFLASTQLLNNLSKDYITKIANVVVEMRFEAGEMICCEGEEADMFYMLWQGEVEVLQEDKASVASRGGSVPQRTIRTLSPGDHFGEASMLGADLQRLRTASCRASTSVVCLCVPFEAFVDLIVPLEALGRLHYTDVFDMKNTEDELEGKSGPHQSSNASNAFSKASIEMISNLGVGGFGKVALVRLRSTGEVFAMKMMAKRRIVESNQQKHALNEKRIMQRLHSPFCISLIATFHDSRYLYIVMEACLGGELWHHLHDSHRLSGDVARFYIGNVVQALAYLRLCGIVYRDLKPENCMITKHGYLKLVDFGFAKMLHEGEKSWTFCGTPEYMAPEIVMNEGHNHAVDLWSLGILTFELLVGRSPFAHNDIMQVYNMIMMGINKVVFPVWISYQAKNLITRLCRHDPAMRLGMLHNVQHDYASIRSHPWFDGMDWNALTTQQMPAPYVPNLVVEAERRKAQIPAQPSAESLHTDGWDDNF